MKGSVGTMADFTPGVGDVKGAVEAYRDPTPQNVVGAVIGLIPVAGDAAKGLIKRGDEIVEHIGHAVDDVGDSLGELVDFIVSPGGTAFPVPKGAVGPTPSINQKGRQTGVQFTGGAGGKNGQVLTMRIMDPTPPVGASPGYPNGYIKYQNSPGNGHGPQGVDPYSGKTLPNKDSHFPID